MYESKSRKKREEMERKQKNEGKKKERKWIQKTERERRGRNSLLIKVMMFDLPSKYYTPILPLC